LTLVAVGSYLLALLVELRRRRPCPAPTVLLPHVVPPIES
jgi:hypothetical protein